VDTLTARLGDLAGALAVSWRIDLYDSEAGPEWQPWESGTETMTDDGEVHLAEQLLAQCGSGPREHRARVLIWAGVEEQPDSAAIFTYEKSPTTPADGPHPALLAEFEKTEKARNAERRRDARKHNTD